MYGNEWLQAFIETSELILKFYSLFEIELRQRWIETNQNACDIKRICNFYLSMKKKKKKKKKKSTHTNDNLRANKSFQYMFNQHKLLKRS